MWELPGSGGVDRYGEAWGCDFSRSPRHLIARISPPRGRQSIFVHTGQGRRISPLLSLTIEFCEIYIPIIRALSKMPGPTFQSKPFIKSSAVNANSFAARYRGSLSKHPFLLFGLPFITTMVAGSFFLTPATALRYERHDRKVKQVSREEAMGFGKDRRKIDMREEYYVSAPRCSMDGFDRVDSNFLFPETCNEGY